MIDGKAEVVALTLGHLGALLVTREAMCCALPLDIPVASAVGAGDSFVGALSGRRNKAIRWSRRSAGAWPAARPRR